MPVVIYVMSKNIWASLRKDRFFILFLIYVLENSYENINTNETTPH